MPSPIFNKKSYLSALRHEPWKLPALFFNDIKSCIQRLQRGYSDDDVLDFSCWFLSVVPDMLQELYEQDTAPSVHREGNDDAFLKDDNEYLEAIQEMSSLFREADVRTCTRKNPLSWEHARILKEFTSRYGNKGEKFMTEEEKQTGDTSRHYPCEVPEYHKTEEKFISECIHLARYQENCKNKAFDLLAEYFYLL